MSAGRVVVIGAGPAGLIAAGEAAVGGARTILLEKNRSAGEKLLLTGKGRCNLTSSEDDTGSFLAKFGHNGKFLYSVFSRFGPSETMDFFRSLGIELSIERGRRVYPASGDARDVLDALLRRACSGGAEVRCGAGVLDVEINDGRIRRLITSNGTVEGDAFVLCTGGKSFPKTGSTGDGYRLASKAGHTIVPPVPALCPVTTVERWPRCAWGLTLRNVSLVLRQGGRVLADRFGELLLTKFGISGSIAMDMSKEIAAALNSGEAELIIDLKPALSEDVLCRRIKRDFEKFSGRVLKDSLGDILPADFIPAFLRSVRIPEVARVDGIGNDAISEIASALKGYRLTPKGLLGFDWAIVTAGGVALDEIDPRSMRSKIAENLFFAGEIIDIDGPTGGFNLQMCWSTGFQAGRSAVDYACPGRRKWGKE
ncbi:MAG: NAD(P)/FAD-dependent oxidoreductase [Synergistaceae bacterium]|nr:NAD(P)/FAD-dependent oxidoreductase [Synergistota bacterium]NLM71387.1 NAD(P)/FAD-dependent oxidoreductase [Synergistaceae bacterium]